MASLKTLLPSALVLLSSLTPVLAADQFAILPTAASATFPACGLTCPVLTQVQTGCVPPQAPVTNDQTYINCFCESTTLQGLQTTGTVCYTCTDATSQNLLVQWFTGYCSGGYTSTLTSTATSTTSAPTSAPTSAGTTTGSATTTATNLPTDTSESSTLSANGQSGKSWISTHWKWIVMIVVLIIGFIALAFGGMWLKKRLDERHPGLYHGDDSAPNGSNNNSTRLRSPTAGFAIPASLRNFSSRNSMNNTAATGTPNNDSRSRNINYHSVPNNVQPPVAPYAQNHGSNRSNPNMSMTSLSNDNRAEMWGPHQATAHTRNYGEINPVDDPAYAASGSRTDLSSVGTRGTPRHSRRLSVNSAANLHRGNEPVSPVSPIQ
ncbi:uncharacterized protein TRUGW13939_01825 [Talaromyces rugulosus]|uniref:Integral membrane protein n=1 Tax=Talaromyces rugulosus TaxID=121627 RepID=A0A7H8QLG6_TALRU|nr:uncharacterized protein TRUGW13939_01825 [Talaromyces rugulosus]QKX54736.1 hypothetical protein TRUGW13939_01825 [Talaromyces rugulosus]